VRCDSAAAGAGDVDAGVEADAATVDACCSGFFALFAGLRARLVAGVLAALGALAFLSS
jgi:hypothetical protein